MSSVELTGAISHRSPVRATPESPAKTWGAVLLALHASGLYCIVLCHVMLCLALYCCALPCYPCLANHAMLTRAVSCRSPARGPHPSPLRGGPDSLPAAPHLQGPPAAPVSRGPPQPLTQFPLELGNFINKLPPERDLQGGHPDVDQVHHCLTAFRSLQAYNSCDVTGVILDCDGLPTVDLLSSVLCLDTLLGGQQ